MGGGEKRADVRKRVKRYFLSGAADIDIEGIIRFSARRWGLDRTERYVAGLHEAFERIAVFPGIGSDASRLRLRYRQFPYASHRIFYYELDDGIMIVRILHERQLPENYL